MNTRTSSSTRKKILVLSPYFPFPPNDGGKVRMYNLIKHLAERNDVYLLSYIASPEMRVHVPAMEAVCRKVFTVVRDENRRITGESLPRSVSFFYTPEMVESLERVMEEVKPDLVQIDFLIMTQYVRHIRGIPAVYTEHDISNINFEQSFHDRDLPEELRFVEWTRLVRFEKEILPAFHTVIVLTERDERILHEFLPGTRSVLIPTGVDVEYFRPAARNADDVSPNLVYIGHYRHYPNYDAVCYFIQAIFPSIAARIPGARFLAVGSGPTPELLSLAGGAVTVTGEVPDVREYLGAADVFVAPIRLGGGIKGKVLEAMASGIPVVATREASEGIRCTNGTDILVADDEKDFAGKIVELLRDRNRWEALAHGGRKLVEEHYDWKKIATRLDAYYKSLMA